MQNQDQVEIIPANRIDVILDIDQCRGLVFRAVVVEMVKGLVTALGIRRNGNSGKTADCPDERYDCLFVHSPVSPSAASAVQGGLVTRLCVSSEFSECALRRRNVCGRTGGRDP